MKKLFALLLALTMILSLGACGSKKLDPKVLTDAMEDVIKNPSVETFGTMIGGTLVGDEIGTFISSYFSLLGMGDDEIIDALAGDLEGATVKQKEAVQLEDDEIKDYQDQLKDAVDSYKDMLSTIEDELADTSDDEWESQAEMFGKSADELKALYNDIRDSLEKIINTLDGAEISEGYRVTVETTDSEGQTESEDICIFNVDGKWFSEALFDMSF